jgi:hypothetical protein
MNKPALLKIYKAALGIATEIAVTLFIMCVALGLCWLITKGIR